jgi:acylphosphatase
VNNKSDKARASARTPDDEKTASASADGIKRLHVFFIGTVQGVGFRYTALNISKNFKMTGWVRNRSDGRVELVAEGAAEELESFLRAIGDEMSGYIDRVERTWDKVSGEFSNFEIRPTV